MPDNSRTSPKVPSANANRHAWALEKYGHLLTEALRKDTSAEARAVEKSAKGQRRHEVASIKRNFAPFPHHLAP